MSSPALIQARDHVAASLAQLDALIAIESAVVVTLDLPDPTAFFVHVRGRLWPRLTKDQVGGCERLIGMAGRAQLSLADTGYVLATAYHEGAYGMVPIRERGGHDYLDKYDTGRLAKILGNTPEDDDDGQKYAGRGDVMTTGYANYLKATKRLRALGILSDAEDMTVTPDLALRPDVSAASICYGMAEGWFTGKTLRDYLPASGPATLPAFTRARPIVNGTDRAVVIAGYADHFQDALIKGGMA